MAKILRFPTPLRLVRHEAVDHWLERHRAILEGRRYVSFTPSRQEGKSWAMQQFLGADPRRPKPQFLTGDDLAEARRLHAPELSADVGRLYNEALTVAGLRPGPRPVELEDSDE